MTGAAPGAVSAQDRHVWLDSLRGWAMGAIVLVHAEQASRKGMPADAPMAGFVTEFMEFLYISIPLIFMVSAYAVALTLWIHVKKYGTSPRSFLAWFARRLFRIAPMYYATIIIYAVIHYLMARYLNYDRTPSFSDILANVFFIHTWIPSAHNSVIPGGWTVSVEFMFYLFAPLIVLSVRWPRAFETSMVAAALAGLGLTYWANGGDIAVDTYHYHWFPTHFPSFVIGLIAFRRVIHAAMQKGPSDKIKWAPMWGFIALAAFGTWIGTYGNISNVAAPAILGISCALLSVAVCGTNGNLVVNRVTEHYGIYSYSIYLLHYVFVMVAIYAVANFGDLLPQNALLRLLIVFVPVMVMSSLVAQVSFRLIEAPGMLWGRKAADWIYYGAAGKPKAAAKAAE